MSRPLITDPKRASEASKFHKDVFALYGHACVFCKAKNATDAAHVIPRSRLGPLRYADPRFARPACRRCHERNEANEIDFPIAVRRDAIKAHNLLAKVKLVMP